MKYFFGAKAQDIYGGQLAQLQRDGMRQTVRGRTTVEILDAVTEIRQSTNPCILIPSRRWNPWLALSEGLWILAGRQDTKSLLPYNSHITDYSDDGMTMYGAYGKRIFPQIEALIERLKNDPNDRRAVLQIWDSNFPYFGEGHGDLTVNSKDPPCNNLVYFKLRFNVLHMTVINRSNDLHYGLYAVNIPTFQMLQQYIAARLGVMVGTQTHFSNSLHIYTDDPRANIITQNMTLSPETQHYPRHAQMFRSLQQINHLDMATACGRVLDGEPMLAGFPEDNGFLEFARVFLAMYRERDFRPEYLDHNFEDWIQAGKNFTDAVWK